MEMRLQPVRGLLHMRIERSLGDTAGADVLSHAHRKQLGMHLLGAYHVDSGIPMKSIDHVLRGLGSFRLKYIDDLIVLIENADVPTRLCRRPGELGMQIVRESAVIEVIYQLNLEQ